MQERLSDSSEVAPNTGEQVAIRRAELKRAWNPTLIDVDEAQCRSADAVEPNDDVAEELAGLSKNRTSDDERKTFPVNSGVA